MYSENTSDVWKATREENSIFANSFTMETTSDSDPGLYANGGMLMDHFEWLADLKDVKKVTFDEIYKQGDDTWILTIDRSIGDGHNYLLFQFNKELNLIRCILRYKTSSHFLGTESYMKKIISMYLSCIQ